MRRLVGFKRGLVVGCYWSWRGAGSVVGGGLFLFWLVEWFVCRLVGPERSLVVVEGVEEVQQKLLVKG